jgi:hypothetical protein
MSGAPEHLLERSPGTGKTTITLQFLLAGRADDESKLADLVRRWAERF